MSKESKNSKIAKELLKIIDQNNFERVFNCVNRVRFQIKDKEIIDDKLIDKVEGVKGHTWVGNQLQVVVGKNSFKVREEVEKTLNTNTNFDINESGVSKRKESIFKRFFGMLNEIIMPVLPIIFSGALIMGITQILSDTNVIQIKPDVDSGKIYVTDMNWISGFIYIIYHSQLSLISIFLCYSTVKYFKGDSIMGISLGLIIASPFFFTAFVPSSSGLQSGGWTIWEVNDFPIIRIQAYPSNIISAIAISIFYVYVDRSIRKFIPPDLDIFLRPVIGLIVTAFAGFFVVLPIFGFIEWCLAQATVWFYGIPFGIGGFLFGFFYQSFVVLGILWPVVIMFETQSFLTAIDPHTPLLFLPMVDASTLTISGTLIALSLKPKGYKEKTSIVQGIFPLAFGASEVAVYGILIKKPKTFWLSSIGSGVAGGIMAGFNLTRPVIGSFGIFGFLGYGGNWQAMLYFLSVALTGALVNFVVVSLFWNEKPFEKTLIKHSLNKIVSFVWIKNKKTANQKVSWLNLKKELDGKILKNDQLTQLNKEYYKLFVEYQSNLNKLISLENKIKAIHDKQQKKSSKIEQLGIKRLNLSNKVKELKTQLDLSSQSLTKFNQDFFNNLLVNFNQFLKRYHLIVEPWMENSLWNAVNDNLIVSDYYQPKEVKISKPEFYQTQNKLLLKFLPKSL